MLTVPLDRKTQIASNFFEIITIDQLKPMTIFLFPSRLKQMFQRNIGTTNFVIRNSVLIPAHNVDRVLGVTAF